jgi:hypothetical protein
MVVLYTATSLIVSHYFNDTLSYKYKCHDDQNYTSYVCFCHNKTVLRMGLEPRLVYSTTLIRS